MHYTCAQGDEAQGNPSPYVDAAKEAGKRAFLLNFEGPQIASSDGPPGCTPQQQGQFQTLDYSENTGNIWTGQRNMYSVSCFECSSWGLGLVFYWLPVRYKGSASPREPSALQMRCSSSVPKLPSHLQQLREDTRVKLWNASKARPLLLLHTSIVHTVYKHPYL